MAKNMETSWRPFLRSSVAAFREYFEHELTNEEKAMMPLAQWLSTSAFTEPCQIAVFELTKLCPITFLVTHDHDHPDCEFIAYRRITGRGDLERRIRKEKPFWVRSARTLPSGLSCLNDIFRDKAGSVFSYGSAAALLVFWEKDARRQPDFVARTIFNGLRGEIRRRLAENQRKKIEESASTLRQDASAISNEELRARVLMSTGNIQQALQGMNQLDSHERKLGLIEQEIKGVRRLIGTTKEYQDFRVLTSTVDDIRRDYVTKPVFDETVRRLEERANALNTRLNDLREVRIWSKRTLVDVILALIATAAAIYAAILSGILHF